MSVEGHLKAASEEEAKEAHFQQLAEGASTPDEYNRNWVLSEGYRLQAGAHEAAARKLASSAEPDACVGEEREAIDACPLAAYVAIDVKDVNGGIRVVYAGASHSTLGGHVRCHVAHSNMVKEQHPGAEVCPLVGEIDVQVTSDERGAAVTMTSEIPAEVERLRTLYVASDEHIEHHPE